MADEFKGGTFDPIKSEDYVAPLQTAYKDINQGMDNYWSQELTNYKYAAQDAGKGLQALADMSETIAGVVKKREEEKKKADYAKGYMWLYENGLPQEDADAFEAGEKVLEDEGAAIEQSRYDFEKRGGSIWESQEFKKLNKAQQHGAVVAWTESKLQQYNPANNEQLKNATSYEEYKAAESAYRMQLYKSLGDINPALVNKYVFEGQRKKEQAAYNSWYTTREGEIKKEEVREANRTLLSCMQAGADEVHCMDRYVTAYQGLHGGKGAAKTAGLAEIKLLSEKGILKEEQTDALLDKTYTHDDGHETTYREQFPKEAADIEDAVAARAATEHTQKTNKNKLDAIADTDSLIAGLDPDQITEDGYRLETIQKFQDEKERQKLAYRGHSDPYLDTAISSLNLEKNKIKEYQNRFDIAFRDGNIDSEKLKEYPLAIQIKKENIDKAKLGDTAIAGETEISKDIEHMVKKVAEIAPGGYDAGARQLTRHLQAKWKKRAIQIAGSDPNDPDPGKTAYDQLELEFQTVLKSENNIYQDEGGNFISPTTATKAEVAENRQAVNAVISKENYYIATMKGAALDSPRLFFSEQELIDMQNDSATLGTFDIPEKAKRIAKHFDNLNAIDVINKQRVALGMEPLTSDSLEMFDGLPTESKFLLNYSATSMTSARAWGTVDYTKIKGLEDKGIVGVGALRPDRKEIEEVAQKTEIPEGHIMAGTELAEELEQEGVVLDFNKPLYPQLSRDQRRAYARLRYKYGDKEALNELVEEPLQELLNNPAVKLARSKN